MRSATAGTVVIIYLVLISTFTFYFVGPQAGELLPITATLVTNFTTVVGIVVAFYFGVSGYVQTRKKETLPDAQRK